MSEFYNEFGLSPEELHVLELWEEGKTMSQAYCEVMIPIYEQGSITKSALNKRVQRFFGTYRMRQAMAASPTERGIKAKADFEKWKESQKDEAIKKFSPEVKKIIDEEKSDKKPKEEPKDDKSEFSFYNKLVRPNLPSYKKEQAEKAAQAEENSIESIANKQLEARRKWIDSLNVTEEPNAISVYGTGQFIMYHAVQEINKRSTEIRNQKISVFDKNGSVFTPTIISALKTASAMIIPFAPAPTPEQRRGMSTAIALLGLLQDNIKEDPDDYTAPPPPTIDIGDDNDE